MKQDLFAAATALAEVLTQENAALRRLDLTAAMAFGRAKEAALLAVTQGRTPTLITDRDPALLALGRKVSELVAQNRTLLERAIGVQTHIVGIIVRAAAPPRSAGQYAASGARSPQRRAAAMALSARA